MEGAKKMSRPFQGHKKCTVCGREDGCRCYSKPPTGGSGVIKPCEHDYEYLYPEYSVVEGDYGDLYIQEDVFYCRKCLDRKTVLARQVKRERPYWFKG